MCQSVYECNIFKCHMYIRIAYKKDAGFFFTINNYVSGVSVALEGEIFINCNPFRDIRNKDNIVAKRGALFMINLKHEVQKRGFTVAHIKTDSIKVPNATPEIREFIMSFGKKYGYSFEHESTYQKMCLVNDAVFIAKYSNDERNGDHKGQWTATGAQFQVPYVFKTLFSKEKLVFSDFCETKSVSTALYLDMNEDLPDVSIAEKAKEKLMKMPVQDEKQLKELDEEISKGHNYQFVGKVGLFCPIKSGYGGGELLRNAGRPLRQARQLDFRELQHQQRR